VLFLEVAEKRLEFDNEVKIIGLDLMLSNSKAEFPDTVEVD
jgi:hypothetical protein